MTFPDKNDPIMQSLRPELPADLDDACTGYDVSRDHPVAGEAAWRRLLAACDRHGIDAEPLRKAARAGVYSSIWWAARRQLAKPLLRRMMEKAISKGERQ